jgi:hypothetical protein
LVAVQHGDGEPVECDQANAAGGLGVADGELPGVLLELWLWGCTEISGALLCER